VKRSDEPSKVIPYAMIPTIVKIGGIMSRVIIG
jgi:hypothetical protein